MFFNYSKCIKVVEISPTIRCKGNLSRVHLNTCIGSRRFAHLHAVCLWPPPKSIYLKTLTNSSDIGCLPLINCFTFFVSHLWFLHWSCLLVHTAASLLVVLGTTSKRPPICLQSPQQKNRNIKRLSAGLSRHVHLGGFLFFQSVRVREFVEASGRLVCKSNRAYSHIPT